MRKSILFFLFISCGISTASLAQGWVIAIDGFLPPCQGCCDITGLNVNVKSAITGLPMASTTFNRVQDAKGNWHSALMYGNGILVGATLGFGGSMLSPGGQSGQPITSNACNDYNFSLTCTSGGISGPYIVYSRIGIFQTTNNACDRYGFRTDGCPYTPEYEWQVTHDPGTPTSWKKIFTSGGQTATIRTTDLPFINGSRSGTRSIRAVDPRFPGKRDSDIITVDFREPPPTLTIGAGNSYTTPPTCPGGDDGSIVLRHSTTPGTAMQYTIVQLLDATSGECTDYPDIPLPAPPLNSCYGAKSNAESPSGATTFTLNNGALLDAGLKFFAGTYRIKVERKDEAGSCFSTYDFTINPPAALIPSYIESTPPSCLGGNDGNARFSITNGVTPFTWRLLNGATVVNQSPASPPATPITSRNITVGGLSSGIMYTFEVTDKCGIVATTNIPTTGLANGPAFSASFFTNTTPPTGPTPPTCITADADNDGIPEGDGTFPVTATFVGGKTYTYDLYLKNTGKIKSVSGQPNSYTFSGLTDGEYWVVATTTNQCTAPTSPSILNKPSPLSVKELVNNVTCSNTSDGKITLTDIDKPNGKIDFNYTVTKNSITKASGTNITSSANRLLTDTLYAGNYVISVKDNCQYNAALITIPVTVTRPTKISIDPENDVPIACKDGRTPSPIQIEFQDGSPNYYINVTKNGSSISGYPKSNQTSTTFNLVSLDTGTYRVRVRDACFISESINFSVTNNSPKGVTTAIQRLTYNDYHLSCFERKDGRIQVDVDGGILRGDTYQYMIELLDPFDASLINNISNNNIATNTNGHISDFSLVNGKYRYLITGLAADIPFQVRVTDYNNVPGACVKTVSNFPLSDPPPLAIDPPDVNNDFSSLSVFENNLYAICKGDQNGSYTARISGGNAPYTVNLFKKTLDADPWPASPFGYENDVEDNTAEFSGLGAGFYKVEVADQRNCQFDARFFEIKEATASIQAESITASVFPHGANTKCHDTSDGSITIEASGGVGNYTYFISSDVYNDAINRPETLHKFTDLAAKKANGDVINYTIALRDTLGCSWSMTNGVNHELQLTSPDTVKFSWAVISDVAPGYEIPCRNDDAKIRVTSKGGKFRHEITINGETQLLNSEPDSADFFLSANTYTASFVDSLGCPAPDQTIVLKEPATHVATTAGTISFPVCVGNNDGQIEVSAAGGIPFPNPNQFMFLIREANAAAFDTDTLRGANVTFLRPANYFTSQDYEIMSIDAHGCSDTIPVTMPVNPDPLTLTSIEQVSPSCYGGTDGYITVTTSNHDFKGGTSLRFKLSGGHLGNTILDTLVNGATVTFNNLQGTDLNGYTAYRAWVEDANNCQDTAYQYIDNLFLPSFEPITSSLIESIRPSCFNGTDGSLLVKISGGVPPYQYSLDNVTFLNVNPADNIVFIDDLAEGTYTFYVIDSNYQPSQPTCKSVIPFDVAPGRFIKLTTATTPISCVGGNDGAINLTAVLENLNEPFQPNRFSLFWTYDNLSPTDSFSTQENITGLRAGRYTAHATYNVDTLTCKNQTSATIQQPGNGEFRISDIITYDASCGGSSSNGIATVSVSGGWSNVPSYYRLDAAGWIPFSNSSFMLSGLSPGSHFIEISQSSFQCNDTENFTIGSASIMLTLEQILKPSCPLNTDGKVIVSSPSANAEFAMEGGDFQPLGVFTGLAKGTHRFIARHITQTTCQSEVLEVVIEDPADCGQGPLSLILGGIAPATCATVQDGQAEVIASGGVPPYQFYWDESNVPELSTKDDLTHGNHTVKVIDAIGSSVTIPVVVNFFDPITFQSFTTQTSCVTSCDGTADLLIDGGSDNYAVSWSGGLAGSTRQDLCTGQYDFTISDTRNPECTVTGSVLIEHYPDLQIDLLTARPPVCPGGTDGYLDTDVSGGSGDYSIIWNNSIPGERLNGHAPGDYMISVTDNDLGCTKEITFTLPDATPIMVLSATVTSPKCSGGNDGKIVLDLGNVSAPLVEWDNGQIGLTASGLKAGTYGYSITGASGCSVTGSEEVTERPALTVTPSSKTPTCFGVCNGSASLAISGGVAPYAIRWSHGPRTSSIVNLCAGTYSYTVTDNLSCQVSGTVVITAPAEVTIAKTSDVKPACFGDSNGSITIEASGGTGDFTYSWSSGQTSSSITGVTAGDYVVTVTDGNQCKSSKTFSLASPSALLLLQDKVTAPSCTESTDGKIIPNPVGGTSPLTYLWNDQSAALIKENLSAGQYTLRVTDAKGCTVQKTYGLQAPSSLAVVNVVPRNPLCFNDHNGSISIEAIGGTSPYAFSWNNNATTAKINELSAGQYTLTVTDKNGCSSVTSYTLANPDQPFITGIPEKITICIGSPTTIEPEGDWSKYQWTGPQNFKASTRRIETSLSGAYTLNTLNLNGCPAQTNFTIEASKDALIADFLRLTEAVVYEPVVFVDISTPQPATLQWITPDNNDVVVNKQSKENIEIVFTRSGTFEIGMIASMGTCKSEIYKTVIVAESDDNPDNSGGRMAIEERPMTAVVYPNPAREEISIQVAVPSRDPVDIWLISPVENRAFFHERNEGQFDYLIEWNISRLTTGVYHLIYKQNNTTRSERIAVIR